MGSGFGLGLGLVGCELWEDVVGGGGGTQVCDGLLPPPACAIGPGVPCQAHPGAVAGGPAGRPKPVLLLQGVRVCRCCPAAVPRAPGTGLDSIHCGGGRSHVVGGRVWGGLRPPPSPKWRRVDPHQAFPYKLPPPWSGLICFSFALFNLITTLSIFEHTSAGRFLRHVSQNRVPTTVYPVIRGIRPSTFTVTGTSSKCQF